MPLDTYSALQASILSWLARPGDPLVSPSIPDIIELFEREATRRLKVGGAEKRVSLTALSAAVALPADFGELRLATSGGVILTYVTPMQLPDGGGPPAHYTIIGNEMRLGPSPSGGCTVEIVYQSGVPPLSDANTTNWLLTAHPDCYLFGSLVEAESFIGSDERIPLWAQRREAAFASIETADRKARWGGAPLSIRAEGVSGGNGTAAGDWTSAPPVPIPIVSIVAGDGLTGGGTEGIVTVALDTPVAVGRGGTGAATAAAALANLGGAPLASPALSGNPTAPTPAPGDADTSIATTAFVQAALAAGGAGISQLTGDVTAGPGSGSQAAAIAANAVTTAKILNANVTYGKLQNVTAARLLGNPTGAGAAPSEISLGTNLSFAGAVLNATAGASGLSGMTAAQIPIAATATTVTSSVPTGTSGNSTVVQTNASGNLVAAVMPAYTGDVTSVAGAVANTLATVNANVGTFQGLTLDAKGRVTAATNQNYLTASGVSGMTAGQIPIAATATTVTSSVATLAASFMPAYTGDVTSSAGATANTLATVNANVGTFAVSTVNAKGLVTAAANMTGDITTAAGVSTLATVNGNVGTFQGLTVNGKGLVTAAASQTGQTPGTATNNNATAGNVGEVISSVVTTPAGITTGVTGDITSISLTAGDWDVQGEAWFVNGTAVTQVAAGINTTSVTLIGSPAMGAARSGVPGNASQAVILPVGPIRLSLASTTTCYLSQQCSFTSTAQAMGKLWARRAR